jgi:hypothetical protein
MIMTARILEMVIMARLASKVVRTADLTVITSMIIPTAATSARSTVSLSVPQARAVTIVEALTST